jgi:hypothetical protein
MKSNKEDLRKRGMMTQTDINNIISLQDRELIDLINAKSPNERSAAIRLLTEREGYENEEIVSILLKRLSIEKSLYTKIEICNALEHGNNNTAKLMIDYLGCIGNNQHKCLPEEVSKKISYPLPRDIIARSLGRMDSLILPILLEVLQSENESKISEVIDSIGYMIFYHKELATLDNLNRLIHLINYYPTQEVIVWKCVICLSAFPLKECFNVLSRIEERYTTKVILKEASRSRKLIRA